MPTGKSHRFNAIPLASYKARGGSRVLSFFTLEKGQLPVSSQYKSSKKSAPPANVPAFSTYEVILEKGKGDGDLYRLVERTSRTVRPRLNAGKPSDAWATASVLAELILRVTTPGDPHPYLFSMLDKAYDSLEDGCPVRGMLIAFFLKTLEHLGFRPRLDSDHHHSPLPAKGKVIFISALGGTTTEQALAGSTEHDVPLTGKRFQIAPGLRATLEQLRVSRFEELTGIGLGKDDTNLLVDLFADYIEHYLEIRLKSLSLWREICIE